MEDAAYKAISKLVRLALLCNITTIVVFSSPIFLFIFLPLVLGVYLVLPRKTWNLWLLVASLLFYAWGEKLYTLIMLASITANYVFGRLIERERGKPAMKPVMVAAVVTNLLLLISFKYANFLVNSLNALLAPLGVAPIQLAPVHLPIGISFFTFHALSYVIDVYRADARGQKNFIRVALYVTLFPQLIAGPILRFHQVADQFVSRRLSLPLFASGVRRFLVGLGKKVLIANTLATPADAIFRAAPTTLSSGAAWLGIICYTLQIYFDFSGYSDMALGLGKMFGFHFPENFNYPYISRSITEFWRRWHISLSTWFRDYLYIPMGGNRVSPARNYFNLVTVFFLCGLWHGASWTFVVWGLYHGLFLVVERLPFARRFENLPRFFSHVYALAVVIVGWVLFRADTLSHAFGYLQAMIGLQSTNQPAYTVLALHLNPAVGLALIAGIVGSTPWATTLGARLDSMPLHPALRIGVENLVNVALLLVFFAALTQLAAGTYNPFIYFRF
jgi:alginate O-acetyltransferase complex protein AlgI